MPSNFDKFMQETKKAIEKELEKQRSKGREIIATAYSLILDGTNAVDTGLYKASHLVSVNRQDNEVPLPLGKKLSQSEIASINSKSSFTITHAKMNNGDIVRLYNNVDYADYIESGVYANPEKRTQDPALYGRTEAKTLKIINRKIKI